MSRFGVPGGCVTLSGWGRSDTGKLSALRLAASQGELKNGRRALPAPGPWSCFLRFTFQGALQGLVKSGLGTFVFLLRDEALFVFHFELEDFFLQGFEQLGRAARRS